MIHFSILWNSNLEFENNLSFKLKRKILLFYLKKVEPLMRRKLIASKLLIDVLIPVKELDYDVLPYVINSIRTYVKHPIGGIFVVGSPNTKLEEICLNNNCKLIDENIILPIKKSDIIYSVQTKNETLDRSGWLFQQLLKWSGDIICQNEYYLTLDADTVLIRPQIFEYKGKIIFNCSDEYHKPYFEFIKKVLGLKKSLPVSVTSHHMIFQKKKLFEIKQEIEKRTNEKWYYGIINNIDKNEISAVSDYETYGQYVISKFRSEVILEYWFNKPMRRDQLRNIHEIENLNSSRFKSLSFHHYNE